MSFIGDLINTGLDIREREENRKIKREETGVQQKLAEAELARQAAAAAKVQSDSAIAAIRSVTLQRVAVILSIATSVLSIAYWLAKRKRGK